MSRMRVAGGGIRAALLGRGWAYGFWLARASAVAASGLIAVTAPALAAPTTGQELDPGEPRSEAEREPAPFVGADGDPQPTQVSSDETEDDGDWEFANPFQAAYDDGPGLLRIGLQVGSSLRTGMGPSLSLVPWEYLRIDAAYGYRSDHNVAGMLSVPILPRAILTPYVTAGYAAAIASLPQGIRLTSHQLVVGLGLEARMFDRYVLGTEITGNGIVSQVLKDKASTIELSPGERISIQGGFHLGVHIP